MRFIDIAVSIPKVMQKIFKVIGPCLFGMEGVVAVVEGIFDVASFGGFKFLDADFDDIDALGGCVFFDNVHYLVEFVKR